MNRKFNILFFCLLSLAFIGCDRATKDFARQHLKIQESNSYFYDTVRLIYVENTGAFLSLGAEWPKKTSFWLLSIFPLIFLSGFFVFIMRKAKRLTAFEIIAFILVFSGGIGNIIDRLIYDRHVTDFLNIGILNFRTGIFNIADFYVTTGAIMILVSYFKKNKL